MALYVHHDILFPLFAKRLLNILFFSHHYPCSLNIELLSGSKLFKKNYRKEV